ncbi:hypothetical protein D3C72_1512010 [compost metagenome]
MGVQREVPDIERHVGAQVCVPAVLAVGEAKEIGRRVRVLERHRAIAQGRIHLGGIGARVAGRIVARVVVLQHADIVGPVATERILVAAVEIHFDRGRHPGIAVSQPADARVPVAEIEAARMAVVEPALNRRPAVRLHQPAVAVVGSHRDVGRERMRGRLGVRLGLRHGGHGSEDENRSCGTGEQCGRGMAQVSHC